VKQVALPKAKWSVDLYESIFGKKPKKILDVGAGAGHFVYACQQLGIACNGIEPSEPSREFCKANFGLSLDPNDFTQQDPSSFSDYDIISFWGVIEHVPNPIDFLATASRALQQSESLVIAAVPRWNAFSTIIQTHYQDTIVRHLDPLGHINVYTENSLATAFVLNQLDPVAAWYYGMDFYELITQLAHELGDPKVIEGLSHSINHFQQHFDMAQLSDEMVLVGVPGVS